MRIKTQFIVTMLLYGVVLAILAVSVIVTNEQIRQTTEQEEIAYVLEREAYELGYLSNDYLLYREEQRLARWDSKYASFTGNLSRLTPRNLEQEVTADNIRGTSQRLKSVFTDVRTALQNAAQGERPEEAFVRMSWSRMEVQNQGMIFDASRLARMLRDEGGQARTNNTFIMLAMVAVFGAFLVSNYLLTYKQLLKSLSALHAGTKIIGGGELDYSIQVHRNDEIGDLTRAFNLMASSLKTVTASKTELEREIAERKRAQDRASRQKAVQEGINRILEAALISDTEEELGRICLTVAESLTHSRFGFLGMLSGQGLLDDVAISNPGWEACQMPVGSGHGRLPSGLPVHGVYGRVLRDGQPLFSNDLDAHPDSIGTPEGHPPITAFLGVPLVSGGKTIGMIGLGNRPEGYTIEDQEAAESLTSAVVEAFERKRAEEEIKKLNINLSRRAAELEASNKELEAFSYSVSHDLRAPLRHMDGYSKALLDDYHDKLDDSGKQFLEAVRRGSQRMSELIDDLLRLSRVTRSEMRQTPVDLSKLAESIAKTLRAQDPDRKVELVIEPCIVGVGDRNLLAVLLENLLGNAWKFTARRQHARIEFGTMQQRSEGNTVHYVRDNGAGFDMTYSDKLFGAFQRLHRTEEFPGNGIGLATVQRIVQRHRGRIWAEGAIDQGATFYFTLGSFDPQT